MLIENHLAALATLIQDRVAADFGDSSPSACALLLTLLNRGRQTVSALAAILGISQPTATRLIEGLEKRGLARRAERDGRQVPVALTRAGRRAAQTLQAKRAAALSELTGLLEPEDREALGRLVAAVLHGATRSRAFARTTCRFCDHGLCRGDDCPVNRRATELEGGGQPC